jgi:hypothetical protein
MQAVIDASAVVVLLASVAALFLTCVERRVRGLVWARLALIVVAGAYAVINLTFHLGVVAAVATTPALLLAIEAWALSVATPSSLAALAESLARDDDRWWTSFERQFWRSVARRPEHPLRAALTRYRVGKRGASDLERLTIER